jgi:hypothetical protein
VRMVRYVVMGSVQIKALVVEQLFVKAVKSVVVGYVFHLLIAVEQQLFVNQVKSVALVIA